MKLQLIKKTAPFFGIAVNITTVILLIVDAFHPINPEIKYSIIGGVSGASTIAFGVFVHKTLQKRANQEAKKERQIERKQEKLAEKIDETCKTVQEIKVELSKSSQEVSPRSIHSIDLNYDERIPQRPRPKSLPNVPNPNSTRENLQRSLSDSPRNKKSVSPAQSQPRSRSLSPTAGQQNHAIYFPESQIRSKERNITTITLTPVLTDNKNDEHTLEDSTTPRRRASSAPVRSPYISVRNGNRSSSNPRFFHNLSEDHHNHVDWVLPVLPSPVSENQAETDLGHAAWVLPVLPSPLSHNHPS